MSNNTREELTIMNIIIYSFVAIYVAMLAIKCVTDGVYTILLEHAMRRNDDSILCRYEHYFKSKTYKHFNITTYSMGAITILMLITTINQ